MSATTPAINYGDLVAFSDEGARVRGIVTDKPISGMLRINVPRKSRPIYVAADQVELLVRAGYDIEAQDPIVAPNIAVIVNEGRVDTVRANAPVRVEVVDLDGLDDCGGGLDEICEAEEEASRREAHDDLRADYERVVTLPLEVYA